MSEKGHDVDLTRAKQNTGVWLVKVGDYLSEAARFHCCGTFEQAFNKLLFGHETLILIIEGGSESQN